MSLAQAAAPVIAGMHTQPDIGLPGIARVLLSVMIVLMLAAIVIYVLKRFLPSIGMRGTHDGFIKVLGKAHIAPRLQAHVLQVDSTRVLVVESRHGVNITLLSNVHSDST